MPLEEARNLRTIKHYENSNHSCGVVLQPLAESGAPSSPSPRPPWLTNQQRYYPAARWLPAAAAIQPAAAEAISSQLPAMAATATRSSRRRSMRIPIEFLPKFGKRMSEVVRRIFYGQNPTGWDNPPPAYGPNGGYSLESAPRQQAAPSYPQPGSGYQSQQPQQPVTNTRSSRARPSRATATRRSNPPIRPHVRSSLLRSLKLRLQPPPRALTHRRK
jgi:hypothetical protein